MAARFSPRTYSTPIVCGYTRNEPYVSKPDTNSLKCWTQSKELSERKPWGVVHVDAYTVPVNNSPVKDYAVDAFYVRVGDGERTFLSGYTNDIDKPVELMGQSRDIRTLCNVSNEFVWCTYPLKPSPDASDPNQQHTQYTIWQRES
jgi:hypothetical protein